MQPPPRQQRATDPPADIETSEPGADPGMAEGWPVGSRRRAGQQPTTGFVAHFGRQEARAVHRVPAAAAGAEMESGLRTCFPTHPIPVETLAGPLTEAIKAVKAFGRPLVQPQIALLGSLVVCEAPGDRGSR